MRLAWLALALAACADYAGGQPSTDGPPAGDAQSGCHITLSFTPQPVHAGQNVRAVAQVTGAPGVLVYAWTVTMGATPVPFTSAAPDNSEIDFTPQTAGAYYVSVDLGPQNAACDGGSQYLNVLAPNANTADYRLHVVPPTSVAPPQDTIVEVDGGADAYREVVLDPGITPSLSLVDGSGNGVAAYVRFLSQISPAATIDVYVPSSGAFSPRVLGQPYDVLIVPASSALAPVRRSWSPGAQLATITAGVTVTGSVLGPSGSALAGATVQLSANGVPSTIATTASNGGFTLRANFASGPIAIDVVSPAGSGLPRLAASGSFDLTQSLQVRYASTLATCNVANTTVKRAGTSQPSAQVTIVGAIASAGTVTAGASATASGAVRAATTADGTGKLPSVLVAKASLSAVAQYTNGEVAVVAFDESACAATTIDGAAATNATGTVTDSTGTPLAGARAVATPTRALALAGVPAIEVPTNSSGHFSLPLATAGNYDLQFYDPFGRGAPYTLADRAATSVPATPALPVALHVFGPVSVTGNPNPIEGAAIQVLCASCTGIAALRPISETATDGTSNYRLAVPDPGTM